METLQTNQDTSRINALSKLQDGKQLTDALLSGEKELLRQVAATFTIITGGSFKKRSTIA